MADLPPLAATPPGCPGRRAPRRSGRWRLLLLAGACSAAFAAPPPTGPAAADRTAPSPGMQVLHAQPAPGLQAPAAAAAPVLAPAAAPALRRWGLRALALGVGAGLGWGLMRLGDGGARRARRRDGRPRP